MARPGDQSEVFLDGYWIDLFCGDHLVEIQTRSFSSLKPKLLQLLETYPVLVVYPVAAEKWIVRLDDDLHTILSRRKSPRKGRYEDLFLELVAFPELLQHQNLTIRVLLTTQEEILCRANVATGSHKKASWRRKGWKIYDRSLVKVKDQRDFTTPTDFFELIPNSLGGKFTAGQLGRAMGTNLRIAQKMLYCLRKMGVVEITDRKKRGYLYQRVCRDAPDNSSSFIV
jgi:hypothetical protein